MVNNLFTLQKVNGEFLFTYLTSKVKVKCHP